MVMITGTISKGSVMDQIYIPKQRAPGLETGTLVVIEPALLKAVGKPRLNYYKVEPLPPVKVAIIEKIFEHFEQVGGVDNVLVAGSFLETGFKFEDIDLLVIGDEKIDANRIQKELNALLGLKVQAIVIDFKVLLKGISSDPLFQMLVSRFVSKKRVIFRIKRTIRFKLLDLHLLDSKMLPDNFEFLTGNEKYKLTRNMVAISLFLDGGRLSVEAVNSEIERHFGKESPKLIKENMVSRTFLIRYKSFYNKLFDRIMAGIKHDPK